MFEKTQSKQARILQAVVVSIPCFVLAFILMRSWMNPMSIDNGRWIRFGIGIMVLEFLSVHAGGMMSGIHTDTKRGQVKLYLALFGFYCVFAGCFAMMFKSWELFLSFAAVMVTRSIGMFTNPEHAKKEARLRSAISVLIYMLAVIVSIKAPIPKLGVTASVLDEVYPDRGSGIWAEKPETALAAGVIYFSLLGLVELLSGLNKPKAD